MSDWRPIETAPRDGTPIFAFGKYSPLYGLNFEQSGPYWIRAVVEFEGGRWRMTMPDGPHPIVDVYEQEWEGMQTAYMEPLYWMPLPAPPEGE